MELMERCDVIDLDRARALAGLLDSNPELIQAGDRLRPMWQVAYLLPRPAQGDLGADGHPRTDHGPGVRRMFAGGRLTLWPGLCLGSEVTAREEIVSTKETTGRAGRLVFVTSRTIIDSGGSECLVDERDVVYVHADPNRSGAEETRRAPAESAPRPEPRVESVVEVDPTLLFRFSALTYNAHRIHYDADYTRDVEGYPGLVVHGPLQALLMAEAATSSLAGPLGTPLPERVQFDYQLISPLHLGQGLRVATFARTDDEVGSEVTDASGRVTARGRVTLGGS
ncbi:mesaconyl-C4 CoA hydratase [Nocardia sp. NPDC051750]|uniref:mesaconyl-C4 CoA hydratase n=1 Tax=Nocardia sp. NPDC051750 TaxID=3364325 RepID=UPI00378CACE9